MTKRVQGVLVPSTIWNKNDCSLPLDQTLQLDPQNQRPKGHKHSSHSHTMALLPVDHTNIEESTGYQWTCISICLTAQEMVSQNCIPRNKFYHFFFPKNIRKFYTETIWWCKLKSAQKLSEMPVKYKHKERGKTLVNKNYQNTYKRSTVSWFYCRFHSNHKHIQGIGNNFNTTQPPFQSHV